VHGPLYSPAHCVLMHVILCISDTHSTRAIVMHTPLLHGPLYSLAHVLMFVILCISDTHSSGAIVMHSPL
ncbi:hypothetical protein NDU88_000608, partial [Pleurodeles waltl]